MKESLTFFTIATPDYFASAAVLLESLKATQEEPFEFCLFSLSATAEDLSCLSSQMTVLAATDAVGPDWDLLVARYDVFELCNAIRPYCFRYLLSVAASGAGLIYLDADILVLGSFAPLVPYLERFPLCLTPHILSPYPLDGQLPDDASLMRYGAYNSGFMAMSDHQGVEEIIEFLIQRVQLYCFNRPPQFFCDQKILDLAVSLFWSRIGHLDFPGFNIAYWNIHERGFKRLESKYYANGEPAVFFHFSGFDASRPEELSRWPGRHSCLIASRPGDAGVNEDTLQSASALKQVLSDYVRALAMGSRQQ